MAVGDMISGTGLGCSGTSEVSGSGVRDTCRNVIEVVGNRLVILLVVEE